MSTDACTAASLDLDEPLAGSAPQTRAWLLVEHHGPWGPTGFGDSGLPPGVVSEVQARADAAGVRIQLIRRHERRGRAAPPDTAYLARSVPGTSWVRRFRIRSSRDLAELPQESVVQAGPPDDGEPTTAPLYLVCTHGRRDACCARFGRTTVAALAEAATRPGVVWETTHTGGHRFASNVVVLPTGHVYGRVGPADAERLVGAHARQRVVTDLLRGRSCDDPWGQVADVAARQHLDVRGIEDVRVLDTTVTDDAATVRVVADSHALTVRLHRRSTGQARPFSCGDVDLRDPGQVEVRAIERTDDGSGRDGRRRPAGRSAG